MSKSGAQGGNTVQQFVSQYGELADQVAQKLGVSPNVVLGQWGLETGWGKSVIPGTNNLGNIKDFTGSGVAATDNQTGSQDKYRAYKDSGAFGDDFAGLVARRYAGATGAGSDANKYFAALKQGGYAEDADYVRKGVTAADMVTRARGGAAPNPLAPVVEPQAAPPMTIAVAQPAIAPILPSGGSGAADDPWQRFVRSVPQQRQMAPQDLNYGPAGTGAQGAPAQLALAPVNTRPNFEAFGGWRGRG